MCWGREDYRVTGAPIESHAWAPASSDLNPHVEVPRGVFASAPPPCTSPWHRPDKRDWWEGFWRESEARWEAAGAGAAGPRTLALLTLALGDLVTTAPSRWEITRGSLDAWPGLADVIGVPSLTMPPPWCVSQGLAAQPDASHPPGLPQANHLVRHPGHAAGGCRHGAFGAASVFALADGVPLGTEGAMGLRPRAVEGRGGGYRSLNCRPVLAPVPVLVLCVRHHCVSIAGTVS